MILILHGNAAQGEWQLSDDQLFTIIQIKSFHTLFVSLLYVSYQELGSLEINIISRQIQQRQLVLLVAPQN